MKICDLTQFYSPVSGGVKRYIEQKVAFVRRARPEDHHVLIIPGEKTERIETAQSTIYTLRGPLVSKTSRYRMLLDLGAVEEILERESPDILESGDPYQVAWKAVVSGRALGIPAVGFYHSHFPEAYIRSVAKYFGKLALHIASDFAQRYVRSLYNRFERTIVPSPALAALLQDWGVENTIAMDLGVDTEIFGPCTGAASTVREEFAIPKGKKVLLYVGRLAAEKNVKTLLAAFEILNARRPGEFHLFAVGDGSLRPHLRKVSEKTGAVAWFPYCSDAKQLASIYRSADLFVHPSLNETFGLVTLESQACGTPVLGIRGSYMDRIIFSDQTHWARENTPEALAGAIEEVFLQNLHAEGEKAALRVREKYSWNAIFTRLFDVYEDVRKQYKS